MTKQEIALQLTLKILETSGGTGLNDTKATDLLEKHAEKKAKLVSIIFNSLLNELNCE